MRRRADTGVMHNDPMLLGLVLHPSFQSRLVFQTAFSFVAPLSDRRPGLPRRQPPVRRPSR